MNSRYLQSLFTVLIHANRYIQYSSMFMSCVSCTSALHQTIKRIYFHRSLNAVNIISVSRVGWWVGVCTLEVRSEMRVCAQALSCSFLFVFDWNLKQPDICSHDSNAKFHENRFSDCRIAIRIQGDGRTDGRTSLREDLNSCHKIISKYEVQCMLKELLFQ
jgi:hypothetical protein